MSDTKIVSNAIEGETIFRRKKDKYRKFAHEGGSKHLERIYALNGMIVSVLHNYETNKEEAKYDSIENALEKYNYLNDMRKSTPEWVDEGLCPAILQAIRAAQKQERENKGLILGESEMGDMDIEAMEAELAEQIAKMRAIDPELDAEMYAAEKQHAQHVATKS